MDTVPVCCIGELTPILFLISTTVIVFKITPDGVAMKGIKHHRVRIYLTFNSYITSQLL